MENNTHSHTHTQWRTIHKIQLQNGTGELPSIEQIILQLLIDHEYETITSIIPHIENWNIVLDFLIQTNKSQFKNFFDRFMGLCPDKEIVRKWESIIYFIRSLDEVNTELIKLLIDAGTDLNYVNKNGETVLGLACTKNDIKIVQMLIKHGANINQADKMGNSPLILACSALTTSTNMVKFLIDNGAKVNHANNDGNTALIISVKEGKISIIPILIKHGAEVNHKNNQNLTALIYAKRNPNLKILKLILDETHNIEDFEFNEHMISSKVDRDSHYRTILTP